MDKILWEKKMKYLFILLIFFLIQIVSAPGISFPNNWDCSEIAFYTFKNEQRLGHNPVLVVGYTEEYAHAWVENEEGDVIIGGNKQWLYETFTDRYYYNKTIPKNSPFGFSWENEWVL